MPGLQVGGYGSIRKRYQRNHVYDHCCCHYRLHVVVALVVVSVLWQRWWRFLMLP